MGTLVIGEVSAGDERGDEYEGGLNIVVGEGQLLDMGADVDVYVVDVNPDTVSGPKDVTIWEQNNYCEVTLAG